MATAPRLPDDEAPLDPATLDQFLCSMGADMVLVGGQALAFWMQRYGIDAQSATISNDGDVLGDLAKAHDIAQRLKAAVVIPDQNALTSLVAQIRVPVSGGKVRNIDVLHLLYTVSGLRKSGEFTRRVVRRSVEVQWRAGKSIRVMHPLDVLESRVQNAVGLLDEKGPHVLTQAVWAIQVARASILRVAHAKQPGDERVGELVQDVYQLAHSRPGRDLLKDHGIEVLDAIDLEALGGATGLEQSEQLERIDAARKKRRRASVLPKA
jgi:hypothetical protein